jgi:hypothetical protein
MRENGFENSILSRRLLSSGTTTNLHVASPTSSWAAELVRDFLVDGLGILLPGLGFLIACVPAFLAPLVWFLIFAGSLAYGSDTDHSMILTRLMGWSDVISHFHVELFLSIIGVSYVIGHLLFRQDIKEPDRKSFLRAHMPKLPRPIRVWRWLVRLCGSEALFPIEWISSGVDPQRPERPKRHGGIRTFLVPVIRIAIVNGRDGLEIVKGKKFDGMVRPTIDDDDLSKISVEYPYRFLRRYLAERGFLHLADIVPWNGDDGCDISMRSKHFINLLKCNLHQSGSVLINTVGKNEAHIRLASSVWYAASNIMTLSLGGIIISVVAAALSTRSSVGLSLDFAVVALLTLLAASFIQSAIEESLHYQRSREIFFVLHASALAGSQKPSVLFGAPRLEAKERSSEP